MDQLLDAVSHRQWYPLAALTLTAAIASWRKFAPVIWNMVPSRWQWIPPILLGASTGFVDAELDGKPFVAALLAAGYAAVEIGLGSIGLAHTVKRAANMKSAAAAAKITTVAVVLLACVGCASFKNSVRSVSDAAKDVCQAVLVERPEVKAQAARDKVSPAEIAAALCAVNDILSPFVQGARRAGDHAVGNAQRVGKLHP